MQSLHPVYKLDINITCRLHCFPLLTLLSFPVGIYTLKTQILEYCNAQSIQSVLLKESSENGSEQIEALV